MTRFCAGTPARALSNETISCRAEKKSASNFRWSSCSRFARAKRMKISNTLAGNAWADKYNAVWSSLTRQFVPYLIRAAEVSVATKIGGDLGGDRKWN